MCLNTVKGFYVSEYSSFFMCLNTVKGFYMYLMFLYVSHVPKYGNGFRVEPYLCYTLEIDSSGHTILLITLPLPGTNFGPPDNLGPRTHFICSNNVIVDASVKLLDNMASGKG